jgi:hypothetical protein
VLGAWLLGAAPALTATAGIDDDETAPAPAPDAAWIIQIPPQATVILDPHGNIVRYEDPLNPAMNCTSVLECWGVLAPSITGMAILNPQTADDARRTAAPPSESSP